MLKLQLQNHMCKPGGFSVRFVAVTSLGFRTCLKLDAILLRQNLHQVATTIITLVNNFNAPSHPQHAQRKITPFKGPDKYMNLGLMILHATSL